MPSNIDWKTIIIAIIFSVIIFTVITMTVPQVQDALRGLQGEVGPQGEPGPQGDTGGIGPTGEAGPVGPQGIQGLEGPMGPQGLEGVAGEGCEVIRKNFVTTELVTRFFFYFEASEPTLVLFIINYDSFSGDSIYVQRTLGLSRYYPWSHVDDLFSYAVFPVPIEPGSFEVVIELDTPFPKRVDVIALVL